MGYNGLGHNIVLDYYIIGSGKLEAICSTIACNNAGCIDRLSFRGEFMELLAKWVDKL